MDSFEGPHHCSCAFHSCRPSQTLPIPVLFRTPNAAYSFWVWLVSQTPKTVVVIAHSKVHTSEKIPWLYHTMEEACAAVVKVYNLPITASEIVTLSQCGIVKVSANNVMPLADIDLIPATGLQLPPFVVHNDARCRAWIPPPFNNSSNKRSTNKPNNIPNKQPRMNFTLPLCPTSPPKRCIRLTQPSPLQTQQQPAADLKKLIDNAVWTRHTIRKILELGGKPLIHINSFTDTQNFVNVNCTVFQPCGRPVRNIFLPLSFLIYKYPEIA